VVHHSAVKGQNFKTMEKTRFNTENHTIEKSGIVRCKKTGEALTCIVHPTYRQKIRFWWKHFNLGKWLSQMGSAASYSIN